MENEYMILEFANGDKINVMTIIGGPVNFQGIIRDVLSIEVDPDEISIEELKRIFEDAPNLAYLYTYEDEEDGDIPYTKIEIGEGYTIVVGIEEVTRKVNQTPGKIVPDTYETINLVTLAQMTYEEWMASGYSR